MGYWKRLYEARMYKKARRAGIRRGSEGLPRIEFEIDPRDVAAINAALRELPEEVRKKVYVGAFRKWAKGVIVTAKSLTPKRSGRLRKSIGTRIRRYRRAVWAAVGGTVRQRGRGRADVVAGKRTLGRDYLGAGWRIHLAEHGFLPGGLIRRGPLAQLRSGVSTRAKTRVPGRGMLAKSGALHAGRLPGLVRDAVDASIREGGLS